MIRNSLLSTIIFTVSIYYSIGQQVELIPPPGQYKNPVEVTVRSVKGDVIYYSLDGHYPDVKHGIRYVKPIRLDYPDDIPIVAAIEPVFSHQRENPTIFPEKIHKVHVVHIYSTALDTLITAH